MPRLLSAAAVRKRVRELGDPESALFLQRFFKTGPGQYGEGDRFLGIRVPNIRRVARESRGMPLDQIETLLHDPWHEVRLLAVVLLGDAYKRGSPEERTAIFRTYLANAKRINN